MQPILKKIDSLKINLVEAWARLQLDSKRDELAKIDEQLASATVWDDSEKAQLLSKQGAALRTLIEPWQTLREQLADIEELLALEDESLLLECEEQFAVLEAQYKSLKTNLLFNGEYDDHGVILRLSAGVGGTDAQDFTEMIERMYLRWAERSGMQARIIERSIGEEAGIKSSVVEISGLYAYGKLKSEHGVHRLVRLSPFNSDNLRQTSFALAEVLPQIDTPDEVEIEDKDLKISAELRQAQN